VSHLRDLDAVRSHLDRWPYFYVTLRTFLPYPVSNPLADRVTTSKTGSRAPGNAFATDVLDLLVRCAADWAGYAEGLAIDRYDRMPHPHGREAQRFATTLDYLYLHADRLLDSGLAEEFNRKVVRMTLVARRAVHADDPIAHLPAPCPRCNRKALIRHNGKDQVVCAACRSIWPCEQYEFLCRVLVMEVNGAQATTARR